MDLFTPVSKTYRKTIQTDDLLSPSTPSTTAQQTKIEFKGASPDEALDILRSQPGFDTLIAVLKYLGKGGRDKKFDIRTPGPLNAKITHVLVTEIVPNYWTALQESPDKKHTKTLFTCLQSLTGINAILAYLRALIQNAKAQARDLKNSHTAFNLVYMVELLNDLLQDDGKLMQIWTGVESCCSSSQIRLLRQEFIALFTNGRLISLSAEAQDLSRQAGMKFEPQWIADSKEYVSWLASGVVRWAKASASEDTVRLCAEISVRASRLGHSEIFVQKFYGKLLLFTEVEQDLFNKLTAQFPPLEQRKVLFQLLKILSNSFTTFADDGKDTEDYPTIWAALAIIQAVIIDNDDQRDNLVAWLTSASGAGIGDASGIRRAAIGALGTHKESIVEVLEKSLNQFGDQLYLKHSPTLQQEAHAQVLLLSAGYVHRIAPMKVNLLVRSSTYLNAISNRLSVSNTRARFLGMVVGEALSGLVHGKDTKLDFKTDEMSTEDADWYRSLVQVSDKAGPLDPLRAVFASAEGHTPKRQPAPAKNSAPIRPSKVPPKTGFIIEEVDDDGGDDEQDDPDLIPYAKPDSDAEDSDDDPTLINRDKPKPPVYIRDLISYFRDTDNYDKQRLALLTAPTLIRRKADYGTEVASHAEELASLLIGLQDKFELESFDDLRIQGMIAVVVAQPKKMGPWFAKTFFDGDYSLSQRASILIVLGLSGREIAGFETSEYTANARFASKTLPSKVEKHYLPPSTTNTGQPGSNLRALPPNVLDNLVQTLSRTFLAPLAAEAADAVTGPDALKISSFTSRLQQGQGQSSKNTKMKAKPRGVRSIPNTTASLLSTSFFFPLTSRFQAAMRLSSSLSSSTNKIIFQPYLLALYVKTLALLIHAAGPSTLALPQMTAELWDLLLAVRGRCLGSNKTTRESESDMALTHAVLMAHAALLDVNENDVRGLCERQGREVVESMEWVGLVFNNTHGGEGSGEENDVKMLAAAILIRLREVVDKYQAVLMGNLIGSA
ncbi:telomere length regulation protein-domain-containing protein [Xylariaceae sp. FL1272]|nr:telomere length regulation protein-domain-containing protein [Xylariaceae sp. FL1272]